MTITIKHLFAIALIALIALLALELRGAVPTKALSFVSNNLTAATTSAQFAVTTSARVLATTTNPTGTSGVTSNTRVYASICNPNANPVALNLNQDNAANLATGKLTTLIAAAAGYSVCYEITDRNLYQGSITASSTNQTSTTIYVQEFVQ